MFLCFLFKPAFLLPALFFNGMAQLSPGFQELKATPKEHGEQASSRLSGTDLNNMRKMPRK